MIRTYKCLECDTQVSVDPEQVKNKICICNKNKGDKWALLTEEFTKEEWEKHEIEIQALYEKIKWVIRKYMDMGENEIHIVALWIIGTYVYEEFNTFPLLFLNATKGSGKTRLLKLLETLCYNGKIQANLSESILFRTKKLHTLFLDEFEQIGTKEKGTLKELLNASYKKGARVERLKEVVKEGKREYVVDAFDLYSPVAMANIWGMDDVVGDRCITIQLDKSDDLVKTRLIEDFDTNPEILSLKSELLEKKCSLCVYVVSKKPQCSWNDYIMYINNNTFNTSNTSTTLTTLDNHTKEFYQKIDETKIGGRDFEIIYPLIMISHIFGNECIDETLEIAKEMFKSKKVEEFAENPDIALLDLLWKKYQDGALEYIRVMELTNRFNIENPQYEPFTAKTIGRNLKRLNILMDKKRDGQGIKIMVDFAKVKTQLERFRGVIETFK